MPYGKKGIKQLQKDYNDLRKNKPKVAKITTDHGDMWTMNIFSNMTKDYIVVAEFPKPNLARKALKDFEKDHFETLAKIDNLIISQNESLDESFKKGDKVTPSDPEDEFYGKSGKIYGVFNKQRHTNYTVKFGKDVISREDDELKAESLDEARRRPSRMDILTRAMEDKLKKADALAADKRKDPSTEKKFKEIEKLLKAHDWDFYSKTGAAKKKGEMSANKISKLREELYDIDKPRLQQLYKKYGNITLESLDEGWGADSQRKALDAENKSRDDILKSIKGDAKLTKKVKEYLKRGRKAEYALISAKKDLGMNESFGVYSKGGSIGSKSDTPMKVFDDKKSAQDYAKRMRKQLSAGEKKYYKMGYEVKEIKESLNEADLVRSPTDKEFDTASSALKKVKPKLKMDRIGVNKKTGDIYLGADDYDFVLVKKTGKLKWHNESEVINEELLSEELFTTIALGTMAGIFLYGLVSTGISILLYGSVLGFMGLSEFLKNRKRDLEIFKNDAKLKAIATKLSKDDQLQKMIKSGNTKGIMKVINSKLTPEEKRYTSGLISKLYDKVKDQLPIDGQKINIKVSKLGPREVTFIKGKNDHMGYSWKFNKKEYTGDISLKTVKSMSDIRKLIKADIDATIKKARLDPLDEGLNLPPEAARKLKASVASKAKGKIIPSVQTGGGKTSFSYTDASGKDHKLFTVNKDLSKKEQDKVLLDIRKKYAIKESLYEIKKSLNEGKKDYEIYHKSYTSAVEEVLAFADKNGYDIDLEGDWFTEVTTGKGRPKPGQTTRHKVQLMKNGKIVKKWAVFQVYGMEGSKSQKQYELNLYIT